MNKSKVIEGYMRIGNGYNSIEINNQNQEIFIWKEVEEIAEYKSPPIKDWFKDLPKTKVRITIEVIK